MAIIPVRLVSLLEIRWRFGVGLIFLSILGACSISLKINEEIEGEMACAAVKSVFFDDWESVTEIRSDMAAPEMRGAEACKFLFADTSYGSFRFYKRTVGNISLLLIQGGEWTEQLQVHASKDLVERDIKRNYMRYPTRKNRRGTKDDFYFGFGAHSVCTKYILSDESGKPSRETLPVDSESCEPSRQVFLWLDYLKSKGLIWQ